MLRPDHKSGDLPTVQELQPDNSLQFYCLTTGFFFLTHSGAARSLLESDHGEDPLMWLSVYKDGVMSVSRPSSDDWSKGYEPVYASCCFLL